MAVFVLLFVIKPWVSHFNAKFFKIFAKNLQIWIMCVIGWYAILTILTFSLFSN